MVVNACVRGDVFPQMIRVVVVGLAVEALVTVARVIDVLTDVLCEHIGVRNIALPTAVRAVKADRVFCRRGYG